MLIMRTLPSGGRTSMTDTLPQSYRERINRDAHDGSTWALVWEELVFECYLCGPTKELAAFQRLSNLAWSALPQAISDAALVALKDLCPAPRDNWPEDQVLALWPYGFEVSTCYHTGNAEFDRRIRHDLLQPAYHPDWPFFVYWKLKHMPGAWFQRDDVLLIETTHPDGRFSDFDFRPDQEHFAKPLLEKTDRYWRITELKIDPFSASALAIDVLLSDQRKPNGQRKIPAQDRTRPLSMQDAAKLMGYARNKSREQAVKALRAAMDAGAIRFERLNRQQYIFNKKDFPEEAWPKLTPTDPKSL